MELKQARKNVELSQVEMAKALGISHSSWRRYENGEREIPEKTLKSLNEIMEQFVLSRDKSGLSSKGAEASKIKDYLLRTLKVNGTDKPVFIDLVDRYMSMWETSIKLEKDINEKGVSVEGATGWKKNDSVAMLVNVNKQMLIILDKLNLNANTIKAEDGTDV